MSASTNARVKMLATVAPTVTDRQTYAAGETWTVPLATAEQWLDDGSAELIEILPAPVASDDESPSEET
jgi:hypothetical protein